MVLGILLAVAVLVAGCSSSHHRTSTPTTTLIQVDRWTPPAVSGPPSQAAFCSVLTAMYRHETELPVATEPVKVQILKDFTATVPAALAVAPADIAGPARLYLTSLDSVLTALAQDGLDYKKLPPGTLTPLLLDTKVQSAARAVLAYSQTQCHYSIGGA